MKFNYIANDNQSKSKKKVTWKRKIDELTGPVNLFILIIT